MGKVAQNSVKYVIEAKLDSNGVVEKPDIVGALFGQTEGLLGEELDLRELQERGRIGRIDVQVSKNNGSSTAKIKIPSSLDATETALLGAALETIERVGPTNADIRIDEIRDERNSKRDYIVKRAKQLLKEMKDSKPEKAQITDEVKEEVRTSEITEYRGFKAGPDAEYAEEVILVEGRADLLNLMGAGVKNAVALGGTSIPAGIEDIGSEKKLTAFLDGDRGGDLILEELREKAEPDFVARAPEKKEVEELGKEQLYESLRDKRPLKFVGEKDVDEEELSGEEKEIFRALMEDLVGTRAVYVLDDDLEIEQRLPSDDFGAVKTVDRCKAVLLDGEVDNRKIEVAERSGADYIIGMKKAGNANSSKLKIMTRDDLEDLVEA